MPEWKNVEVPNKSNLLCLRIRAESPPAILYTGSHTQACIYHVKWMGISEGIAIRYLLKK